MAGAPKPIPSDAAKYDSIQEFQKICSEQIPDFQLSEVQVHNRVDGDGAFELVYNHPDKDQFCQAKVLWPTHDMTVIYGRHQLKKMAIAGYVEMNDTCKLTKGLAGEEELQGASCDDEWLDPRLKGKAEKHPDLKTFLEEANKRYREYLKTNGKDPNQKIELNRVLIVNDYDGDGQADVGDGEYHLVFFSKVNNFFVDAHLNTTGEQLMTFRSGSLEEAGSKGPDAALHATGACTMTRDLLGEEELLGPCNDHTAGEQMWEAGTGGAIAAAFGIDLLWGMGSTVHGLAVKRLGLWGALKAARFPVSHFITQWTAVKPWEAIKNYAPRAWNYTVKTVATYAPRAWNFTSGVVKTYGPKVIASVSTTLLPAGLGTFTTETAALGLATKAGWVGVAGAIGVGTGMLLNEYLPKSGAGWGGLAFRVMGPPKADSWIWKLDNGFTRAFDPNKTVGDTIAVGIKAVVGKPSDTTISVLDHMGFGGWNVFKNRWGLD